MWEEEYAELSSAAGRQNGVFTIAQAARLGITAESIARFKEKRLLLRLAPDVYQQHRNDPVGPMYSLPYAEWLALYPELFAWERSKGVDGAVVSHESASQLHEMGTFGASRMVFTMPEEREAPRAPVIHVAQLSAEDIMLREGIPVTTPLRTIVDLMTDYTEHYEIARVLWDAVRKDLVDLQEVHRGLAPLATEHDFPAGGREFVEYFVPDLPLDQLSARNMRAFTALMFPEKVAEVAPDVRRLVVDARSIRSAAGKSLAGDEELSAEITAYLVGRSIWPLIQDAHIV